MATMPEADARAQDSAGASRTTAGHLHQRTDRRIRYGDAMA